MDIVPTVQSELEDNGRELSEECLSIPQILRRILEQFSAKELIQLSLVNKFWNFEARSVLRDRGCLRAVVSSRPVGRSLVELASDLEQMRLIPLTGIHIEITESENQRDARQSAPYGVLDPFYQIILDRLPWRHLSVRLCHKLKDPKDCSALLLVKKILEDYCGVLEEVSLWNLYDHFVEFFQTIFQGRRFPCLKTLKVQGAYLTATPELSIFAKALVSSAPSLKTFYWWRPAISTENIMEGSSAVLFAADGLYPFSDPICESLIGSLRTEKIFLGRSWGFDVELLNRLMPMLLEASHKMLKTLAMDLLFTLPLICYGICLENVSDLWISINGSTLGSIPPDILALVRGFDFTRVFPKLNQIFIRGSDQTGTTPDDVAEFVERGKAVLREALPDRTMNIKHLKILRIGNPTVPFLAQMFPHVTTVSVQTLSLYGSPVQLLWENFERLVELHAELYVPVTEPITMNWDSAICGIFPEEVAELRAKDDEYLKAVNIVPVMPSIVKMRDLRLFTLRYSTRDGDKGENSNRLISKVTGLIGFARCPYLSVELSTPSYLPQALNHMKPDKLLGNEFHEVTMASTL